MYYDKAGRQIDTAEWARLIEDVEARKVGLDMVADVRVSTVWLGLDHGWGEGAPLIFETMVFGGALDEECVRYSTLDEAEAGHAAMLARVHAAARAES